MTQQQAKTSKDNQISSVFEHKCRAVQITLRALSEQGFSILEVHLNQTQPIIWIDYCERCQTLGGSWFAQFPTVNGSDYLWQKMMHDCRVQWLTHSPHNA